MNALTTLYDITKDSITERQELAKRISKVAEDKLAEKQEMHKLEDKIDKFEIEKEELAKLLDAE